jgi:uncharacterized protein YjbJ (UPF0337 family)
MNQINIHHPQFENNPYNRKYNQTISERVKNYAEGTGKKVYGELVGDIYTREEGENQQSRAKN